jgi:ArpU family phage transcriptional regulator
MAQINTMYDHIDEKRTAANAEALLLDYRHRQAVAKRSELALQSPILDGMPSVSNLHSTEENIIRGLDDQNFIAQCRRVIAAINNEEYQHILNWLYITPLPTVQVIMERLGMSTTAYYHAKQHALVAFAELWPPSPSELLVYK